MMAVTARFRAKAEDRHVLPMLNHPRQPMGLATNMGLAIKLNKATAFIKVIARIVSWTENQWSRPLSPAQC
jgi:hypothetical protein